MNPQGSSTVAAGIAGAGLAGAVTTLICWSLSLVNVQVPGEAAAAISAILASISHHYLRNKESGVTVKPALTVKN